MIGARQICILLIQKQYFKMEPSDIQKFDVGSNFSVYFNIMAGLAIDMNVIKYKKWFIVIVVLMQAVANVILIKSDSIDFWFYAIFFDGIFANTRCAIFNAWVVQQSRKDIEYGAGDLQTINNIFGILGIAIGSILATFLCEIQ